MKRVKGMIKLTNHNAEQVNRKDLCHASGGTGCGCYYATCGGSSYQDNYNANDKLDLDSPCLPPYHQAEWGMAE